MPFRSMFSPLPPPRVTPQSGPWNDPGEQVVYNNARLLGKMVEDRCDDWLLGDLLVPRYGMPAIGSERKERQLREQLQLQQQQYQQYQLSRDSSQETNRSVTSSNEAAASITPATTASASGSPPNAPLTPSPPTTTLQSRQLAYLARTTTSTTTTAAFALRDPPLPAEDLTDISAPISHWYAIPLPSLKRASGVWASRPGPMAAKLQGVLEERLMGEREMGRLYREREMGRGLIGRGFGNGCGCGFGNAGTWKGKGKGKGKERGF